MASPARHHLTYQSHSLFRRNHADSKKQQSESDTALVENERLMRGCGGVTSEMSEAQLVTPTLIFVSKDQILFYKYVHTIRPSLPLGDNGLTRDCWVTPTCQRHTLSHDRVFAATDHITSRHLQRRNSWRLVTETRSSAEERSIFPSSKRVGGGLFSA